MSSTLYSCVLTGNSALNGGGAYNSTANNSTFASNSAASSGGGAYAGTLNNCALTGNSASQSGGGTYAATLNNCTLAGNSASQYAGGVYSSMLRNCIVFYNSAPTGSNYYNNPAMSYCCTTPQPITGLGNITNAPLFVDQAGGNLRLQSTSPCINRGLNSYATGSIDLDGNPRIVGGTVDVGAYECQSPALLDYYVWLQSYGLSTAAAQTYADSDNDGMNNWQEWVAGTDPTSAASVLRLLPPVVAPAALLLRWNSDTNHVYFIERASGLGSTPAFSLLQSDVPGQDGTTTFTDPTAPSDAAAFYRVGIDSSSGPASLWLEVPQFVPANVMVTWTSVTNRSYVVERSTGMSAPMLFTPVATNVPGQVGTTSYIDTTTSGPGPLLYRVRVE